MSNRRWLDIAEYASLSGSAVGLVVSFVSQQAVYATAPLSACILLNLISRQRLQRQTTEILPVLDQLDNRLIQDNQAIQTLRRNLLVLPTPDDLGALKETIVRCNRETYTKAASEIGIAKTQMEARLKPLEAIDLQPLAEQLARLESRQLSLAESLTETNQSLENLAPTERVDRMERAMGDLVVELVRLQDRIQEVADQPPPDLSPLETALERLQKQLSSLPPPYNATPLEEKVNILRQEVEKSIQTMSNLASREDLTSVFSELEKLRQRQQHFNQTINPLRGVLNELQGQLTKLTQDFGRLNQEFIDRPERGLIEELRRALAKTAKRVVELQEQLGHLVTPAELTHLRKEVQEVIVTYTDDLQEQLVSLQQSLINLQTVIASLQHQSPDIQDIQQQVSLIQSCLPELRQQLMDVQQSVQTLDQHQNSLEQQIIYLPESTSHLIQTQMELLTTKLEEIETWVEQSSHLYPTPSADTAQSDSDYPSVEQIRDSDAIELLANDETVGDPVMAVPESMDPQLLLETALDEATSTFIVTSAWLEQCHVDSNLLERFDDLLSRNVQLEIGWSPAAEMVGSTYQRINQREQAFATATTALQPLLRHFKQLGRTYAGQYQIIPVTNRDRLLIVDRQLAVFVEEAADDATRVVATDQLTIETLLERFERSLLMPQTATDYSKRASAQFALEDLHGAIADYTQGLQLDANDASAYNNRGVAFYQLGARDRALADFDQALELEPEHAIVYFNRATVRTELSDRYGAVEDYTTVLRLNPQDQAAYNNRGLIRCKLGDYQSAYQDYTAALQIDQTNPVTYNNRGLVRSKLGDKSGAIADYTAAIQFNPNDDTLYFNRGAVRASLRDYLGALQDYTTAIQLNPHFVNAYNNRGFIYQKLGDKQAAIADFNRAIEINPAFANAYNNRGTAYSKLKNFQPAIQDFNQAIHLNPNFANAYHNRGLALADQGDLEHATEDLMCAARLFCNQGDEDSSQQALSTLRKLNSQPASV